MGLDACNGETRALPDRVAIPGYARRHRGIRQPSLQMGQTRRGDPRCRQRLDSKEPQNRQWPQRQQHHWMKDSSAMPQLPYCFVLMPFGIKSDPMGTTINFDRVYTDLIEPAIRTAGLDPIRADNEMVGG